MEALQRAILSNNWITIIFLLSLAVLFFLKLFEAEKLKATNQITQAKNQFMSELANEASALAMKRLPQEINDSDHSKLLDLFVSNLSEVAKKSA